MSRRMVPVAVGLLAVGLVALRAALVAQQQGQGGSLGESLQEFAQAVREAMAEREQELRETLGLDGTHDAVDAHL